MGVLCIRIEMATEDGALIMVNLPGDPLVEFESQDMDAAPPVFESAGKLRIGDREFPFLGSYSAGNQFWRGYSMPLPVAVEFLCWLHESGRFDCTQAESEFFTRWRWRDPLTEGFVERYLTQRHGESQP